MGCNPNWTVTMQALMLMLQINHSRALKVNVPGKYMQYSETFKTKSVWEEVGISFKQMWNMWFYKVWQVSHLGVIPRNLLVMKCGTNGIHPGFEIQDKCLEKSN